MPTDYQAEKFKNLYRQFRSGNGISDRLLIDAFGSNRAPLFFPTLKDRMLALDDARKEVEKRLGSLDRHWHEIVTMVRSIDAVRSLEELVDLHRSLNSITVELFLHHVGVMELHQMITFYRHRITEKVIELVLARVGKPPCPFAWFNMGSDGRQEQTFFTDQDNALVYEVDGSTVVDDYFLEFADQAVHDLDTAGFALCTGNIMPVNDDWRGSYAHWREAMEEVFNNQVQENLLRIIILMDVTYCAGVPAVGKRFIEKVHTMIHQHFDALMTMARSAVMSSVGLNFFKKFRLEHSGEHAGKFNVKLFGWAPLIMTTRVFALKYEIQATNTVARLQALEAAHHFDAELSHRLQRAYLVLTRAKMISQVEAIVSGSKYDYYLDPKVLPDDEREELREALISVEALQKLAYNSFFGGMM